MRGNARGKSIVSTSIPKAPAQSTSRFAVASLIFGILGILFGLFAILAIIFGHIGRSKIRSSGGHLSGSGLALAGLIMGYIMLALNILILGTIGIQSYQDYTVKAKIAGGYTGDLASDLPGTWQEPDGTTCEFLKEGFFVCIKGSRKATGKYVIHDESILSISIHGQEGLCSASSESNKIVFGTDYDCPWSGLTLIPAK